MLPLESVATRVVLPRSESAIGPGVGEARYPVPATTDKVPSGAILSIRLLVESVMNTLPVESTAMPFSVPRLELVAGPGVGRPEVPVPANTDRVPPVVTLRTLVAPDSAM